MVSRSPIVARVCISISFGLLLPGCPLSDDYFVDSNMANRQVGGAANNGGSTSNGGAAGTGTLNACNASSCSGSCCVDECVDLSSDPSNCGACGVSCSGGRACNTGKCAAGWVTMAAVPAGFAAREKPAFVAIDDGLFIFGGVDVNGTPLRDGAIYYPNTNRWKSIAIDGSTPSVRRFASAVWTGNLVLVYGGREDAVSAGYADAAAYDPKADRWLALPSNSNGRVTPIGVSNSLLSAFWGGFGVNGVLLAGAERFDWTSSTWTPATSLANADPGVLDNPAWAFTGQYLYLYGGRTDGNTKTNLAYSYNLVSNSWASLTSTGTVPGPTARWGAFGVWDGQSLFVWGGRDEMSAKSDGAYLSSGVWTAMAGLGAPTPRWAVARFAGWGFARAVGDVVLVGGQDFAGNSLTNGARYQTGSGTSTGSWTAIPSWKSGENHQSAAVAYVGGALVIWGGRNGLTLTATGDRWAP